jgi:hypothetical protein
MGSLYVNLFGGNLEQFEKLEDKPQQSRSIEKKL